ncbi:MAG: glycosyltransferase family 4 protein [Halioglobus sp.]
MSKPSLILIARNFPPLVGGIENMMASTLNVLADDYEVTLVGPKGCRNFATSAHNCYQLPTHPALFMALGLILALWLSLRYRPQHVLGSNGIMAPLVWLCAVIAGAKSFLFLHGRDIVSNSRLYKSLIWPFCGRMNTVSVNSKNSTELALAAGISQSAIVLNHPCIRRPLPQAEDQSALNDSLIGIDYLLYAGRIIPRKGLLPFLQNCSDWLKASELKLMVVGDLPEGQAGGIDRSYLDEVKTCIKEKGLEEHVQLTGKASDTDMGSYMQGARLHIMPLIEEPGDVEGFGMVAVEAASYGTATIAFNCGGVADAIPSRHLLIRASDYEAFCKAIENEMSSPSLSSDELKLGATNFFEDKYFESLTKTLNTHP